MKRWSPALSLVALTLMAAVPLVQGQSSGSFVLNHVRVVDGSGGEPIEDGAIHVARGKIHAVGPSGSVKTDDSVEVINLNGKTVVPGIINLHGHVGLTKGLSQAQEHYTRENVEAQLRTLAEYGVTTTTSLGTDLDLILNIRDEQRQGRRYGARVYTALQGFTRRGGYPLHVPGVKGLAQEVATPAQGRAWVDRLHKKGADVMKMWVDDGFDKFPKLTPRLYGAMIERAHKNKMRVFAHLYELEDAKGLADAGVDVIAHSIRDTEVDDGLISDLKSRGIVYAPTLTREQSTFVYATPPSWLDDPFFTRSVSSEVIQEVKTTLRDKQANDAKREVYRKGFEIAMKNLKKLADGGVLVGFGTDSGPPGRFLGYFEHWEAELMVEAGLSPSQVIQAWSSVSAKALGIDGELGTIEKGKAADLIVLDKNPLEDIKNTRTIHAVYIAGKRFE